MDPELILALDVGGTNIRARVARLGEPEPIWGRDGFASDKGALEGFLSELLKDRRWEGVTPSRCAIDFAGPVTDRRMVRITNWPDHPELFLHELESWHLPCGRTLMLNDLEAGASGLLSRLEAGTLDTYELHPGRPHAGGNAVLLAPGTGLGTAGIVALCDAAGEVTRDVVASEVQHTAASPIAADHGLLIRIFEAQNGGEPPSWEEFVSSKGLARTYDGLAALRQPPTEGALSHPWHQGEDPASAVADAARCGDPVAVRSLQIYYGCAARVAQMLALTYLPRGGVFLAGATTGANQAFIQDEGRSGFVTELQANPAQAELLKRFPVHLIPEDLNLDGCLWACRERMHLCP